MLTFFFNLLRDRLLHSSKSGGAKDIFTECAKDDDNTIKAQIKSDLLVFDF